MALQRYTRSVDGTIPVPALLYDDEELLASQNNTGIYDGLQKSPAYQAGTIHVSTHRLFYIDARHPFSHSFAMDLSYINRTEYYAGLFKSSPKVTMYLYAGTGANGTGSNFPSSSTNQDTENVFESWECEVCGNRNPPGLSPTAAKICTLCGVPRSSVPIPIKTPAAATTSASSPPNQGYHLSSSLPASVLPSASSSSASLSAHSNLPQPYNNSGSTRPAVQTRTPSSIACPACTFLNHPSMRLCEMCSTPLPRLASSQTQPQSEGAATPGLTRTKSAPSSRPASPDLGDDNDDDGGGEGDPSRHMIKLSFRKGGDKIFYAVLKRTVMGKAWEGKAIGKGRSNILGPNDVTSDPNTGRSGIHGILRTVETSAQNTATDMSDALKDLEALRVKAKDMVRLAAELNERLTVSSTTTTTNVTASTPSITSTQSLTPSLLSPSPSSTSPSPSPAPSPTPTLIPSTEPEEATFIRSSLSQLGLQMSNAPVTLDMIQDERKWIDELARELAGVLQGRRNGEGGESRNRATGTGMMKERGIVALDEIWGGWNRARGIALIPPSTFLLVLPHLPHHTAPPIRLRTFPSGLSVLHTPAYTHASFASRLASLLALMGPRTTMDVAGEERLTVGLAREMIGAVEADGEVCRDEGGAGGGSGGVGGGEVRWWVNVFRGYVWDGQE